MHFEFKGFANEKEHLKESDDKEKSTLSENVLDLIHQGKSYREVAQALGISKSLVGNIVKKSEVSTLSTASNGVDSMDNVDSKKKEVKDETLF